MPVAVDQHVCGLNVQVEHAVFVCKGERLRERIGDAGGLVIGEGVAVNLRQKLFQRKAVDVLHHQVGKGFVKRKVDDRDDVWVREHARGARLGKGGGRGRGRCDAALRCQGNALDGHAALQTRVEADLDAAKTAGCARLKRAIAAQQGRRGLRRGRLVHGCAGGMLREQRHARPWCVCGAFRARRRRAGVMICG